MIKQNYYYKVWWLFLIGVVVITAFLLLRPKGLKPPNIIFITVDSLRADHLGCYGYPRNTSPNIDKLAKTGVMFEQCFATSNCTALSFPGIVTGRYLAVTKRDHKFKDHNLDEKFNTLAEYLKNKGYYTVAVARNPNISQNKGYAQGFDLFIKENPLRHASETTQKAIDILNNYRGNKPVFIWMHYMGVHAPYNVAPEEYVRKFKNDQWYKENDRILKVNSKEQRKRRVAQGIIPRHVFKTGKYNLNHYIAAYDAAIFYTDFYIGKLLENINDNTIVVLTADHGESLGENNRYFYHGGSNSHDSLLHVPLIIKDNRYFKAGKRITGAVSSVDIVPTVLSQVAPAWYFFNQHKFDGIDLLSILDSKDQKRKYIYSYHGFNLVRDTRKKVKYVLNQDNQEELFFLPDENTNRIEDSSPETVKIRDELRKNLKKWLKQGYPIAADINSEKVLPDKESKKELKSLGYL